MGWPKYVRLQRQKRIMLCRLKVPPTIAQFNQTIDKNQATSLLRLCKKYMPETREAKKNRLMEMAQHKKQGDKEQKNKEATGLEVRFEPCHDSRGGKGGQARSYRPRRRPHRAGVLAA